MNKLDIADYLFIFFKITIHFPINYFKFVVKFFYYFWLMFFFRCTPVQIAFSNLSLLKIFQVLQ